MVISYFCAACLAFFLFPSPFTSILKQQSPTIMSDLNISDFQYPPRGFVFPPSACNATWQGILTAKPLDLSYPPADPLGGQLLFIAGMICRFSEDASVSDLAWHVYSKLTAFGCKSGAYLPNDIPSNPTTQTGPHLALVYSPWSYCKESNAHKSTDSQSQT
jgi:hypothetical protein